MPSSNNIRQVKWNAKSRLSTILINMWTWFSAMLSSRSTTSDLLRPFMVRHFKSQDHGYQGFSHKLHYATTMAVVFTTLKAIAIVRYSNLTNWAAKWIPLTNLFHPLFLFLYFYQKTKSPCYITTSSFPTALFRKMVVCAFVHQTVIPW